MKKYVMIAAFNSLLTLGVVQGCTITTTSDTSSPDGGASNADSGGANAANADDGGASADGSSASSTTQGCTFGEPNDTRDQPFALTPGTYKDVCLSDKGDVDYYAFTSPSEDKAGGYVIVSLTNVRSTATKLFVSDALTNEQFTEDGIRGELGESTKAWFTVQPGKTYHVRVEAGYSYDQEGKYDITIDYKKIDDPFEPNNTQYEAAPIAFGTSVSAFVTRTRGGEAANLEDDWYKLEFNGGNFRASLASVPTNFTCEMALFDNTFTKIGREDYQTTDGANCEINRSALQKGTYYLQVKAFSTPSYDTFGAGEPADHITRKYTLTTSSPQ